MTTLVPGRAATLMFALWSGYIATWATVSGSRPAIVAAWWLAGVALLQAIAHHLARPTAMRTGSPQSAEHADIGAPVMPGGGEVQDWESEGGAIA